MINSVLKIIQGWVKLRGNTDNTFIGNTGDRLKVDGSGVTMSIAPADNAFIDSVGRQRISDVSTIGSYCFYSTMHDLQFNTLATGSATATFVANAAATRLTNTTSSSDSIIRQSKRYFSYAPGVSHSYSIAATIGAKKTNVVQRLGHFDTNNGCFFQQDSTNLAVVIRTSTSGAVVNTAINQSSWNLDKLDGTGASGITLDVTKHNKYIIDSSWYGAGRVRFGVFINGATIYCHSFDGANSSALPYTRTPKLPLRFELVNTGTTASTTTMDVVCMTVTQESTHEVLPSYTFSRSNGRTGFSVSSTSIPLLSLRLNTTFNGITNRCSIFPVSFQGITNQQAVLIQIILNPTLTGSSFASVNSFSAAQVDTSATAYSGGTVVAELYVPSADQATFNLKDYSKSLTLGLDIAGTTSDILTVAAISLAGASTTWGAIQWEEAQ